MLNVHIRKITLKNGGNRYRTIFNKSGNALKLKHDRLLQRDGEPLGIKILEEFQRLEIKRAKEVASILGVEVTIVDTEDCEKVDVLEVSVDN